ncbi:MAG: hypothetical protein LC737_09955, partial [Chloroflexi bacterium]|nr:hypothetical protein [Chloroflexota bacterium]
EAIEEFARELADRFGTVPEPASNLLYLLRLKVLAAQIGVDAITTDDVLGRVIGRVRDRIVLLEWRPSRAVERVVSVARNTFSVPLADGWIATLEQAMREMAWDAG